MLITMSKVRCGFALASMFLMAASFSSAKADQNKVVIGDIDDMSGLYADQAAYYSATMTYLNAVKVAGTTDADKVMAELKKAKIDDMFTSNGKIREDGLMEHEMYIMQVKTPAESKGPWDYYRVVQTMSGEDAYGKPADTTCPLVKH